MICWQGLVSFTTQVPVLRELDKPGLTHTQRLGRDSQPQPITSITPPHEIIICECIRFSSEDISVSNSIHYSHGKKQSYFKIQPLDGRNWWGTQFFQVNIFLTLKLFIRIRNFYGKKWTQVNSIYVKKTLPEHFSERLFSIWTVIANCSWGGFLGLHDALLVT